MPASDTPPPVALRDGGTSDSVFRIWKRSLLALRPLDGVPNYCALRALGQGASRLEQLRASCFVLSAQLLRASRAGPLPMSLTSAQNWLQQSQPNGVHHV